MNCARARLPNRESRWEIPLDQLPSSCDAPTENSGASRPSQDSANCARIALLTFRGKRLFRQPSEARIAVLSILAILLHLALWYLARIHTQIAFLPVYMALLYGGVPLVIDLVRKLMKREFGSDHLAGLSILTAVLLGQFLVATIVGPLWITGYCPYHFV